MLDFGLARHDDGSDAVTQSGALTGTPAYMAPELLDGRPATVRSDLFALGAVLYECATGKRAFEGPTVTAILKAVTDHEPPAPVAVNPGVPAALSALVVRLLAKNPADRPASAPEVATALAGAPTATWHPDAPPPVDRVRPARQIRLGCVITISLCLLIGIGAAALLERESGRRAERAAAERRTAAEQARQEAERLAAEARRAALSSPSPPPGPSVRYRGRVDVKLARTKDDPLMRLNVAGALPMRPKDVFTIEGEVNPPAYLYLVWVDPGHDVTPVYPWDAAKGWGSRPAKEEPRSALRLPADVSKRYTAPTGRPGVATMVLFACEKPLAVPDAEIEGWFKDLPELPLPGGREDGAMWFDNYAAADDPLRGTFGEVDADAFGRWQGKLKKALGGRDAFQTAVSFARTGKK
ncbi:MAG: serine/threonine protein kinase [Planctomycetes bacterium]|nr:serine/threonine protein kinase [Planctomycetota bacterium]